MIHTVIIEDNEKDIKSLKQILTADARFSVFKTVVNGNNWNDIMARQRFDAVFADIELNGKNVFNLLKTLPYKPEIIVVSNYPKYALQAFNSDALHFLTKPLRKEHILTAMERLHRKILLKEHKPVPESFFLQVSRNNYEQLFFNNLVSIKAESEYIKLCLANDKPILVYERLKNIIAELPPSQFIQVHRSAIVNVKFIRSISGNTIHLV
ncbi:MAG: LytR/AlgR family response regulator transcription factor, partial [Bacteroidota bacterium]